MSDTRTAKPDDSKANDRDATAAAGTRPITPVSKATPASPDRTPVTRLPATIGRYRIHRKLGEGGMGVVFEAEQQNPRRPVAVKVVLGGRFVDEQQVRLLQREAQALARLRHPDIASIYEAGRTEEGQHFFAMELIRGETLGEYVHTARAPVKERLRLFVRICNAISYAHQRGVMHRDIKPSNILVDRQGNPKILDFGLARISDADVTATTKVTTLGSIQGTLAYMSPEQARGNPDEIDVRSDVYSLGIILFELLTDTLPYDISSSDLPAALRAIVEKQAPRPSAINRALRGDLETIVLKALEKDPGRRYQSASALAEDIERHLSDQPILARPASAFYHIQKLVARHRPAFFSAAALLLLLVAFAVTMTVQSSRIARERDRALAAERLAQRRLEESTIAHHKAQAEAKKAVAIGNFLQRMLMSADPQHGGRETKVIDVLDGAVKELETSFADQPEIQVILGSTLGATFQGLGLYGDAETQYRAAVDRGRRLLGSENEATLTAMTNLADLSALQGNLKEAESLCREVLETRRRTLGEEHPQTLLTMNNLAAILSDAGKLAEAEALLRQTLAVKRRLKGSDDPSTLATMNNLTFLLDKQGKLAEAEPLARELLQTVRRVLGDEHPHTLSVMNNLAAFLRKEGKYGEAEALYTRLLASKRRILGDSHPSTFVAMNGLARTLFLQGKFGEAEALAVECYNNSLAAFGADHKETRLAADLLVDLYNAWGRPDRAREVQARLSDQIRRAAQDTAPSSR